MRPPRPLVRRAVLDPLWLPLAVSLAGLFCLAAAASVLVAPLAKRRRVARLALFGALYVLVDAGLVVCCGYLWLRYPVPKRRGRDWAQAHVRVLRRALDLLVAASGPLLGFRALVEELPAPESLAGRPLLVLARHGGPGDSFAIAELLLTVWKRRPVIVLKESLRWDPGLDVLLGRMPSCFLPARGRGQNLPARIGDLASGVDSDDAILLFPEGGNWTPRRHRNALARLWVRGRRTAAARAAANPHVLPPQPAGVLACLAARNDLEVVLVAHTGLEDLVSAADIWRALPVGDRPMVMRWWHPPATELPAEAGLQQDWLDVQWTVVDSWIDARKAARQRGQASPLPVAEPAAVADVDPGTDGLAGSAADAAAGQS
jgi:1-acyl-sn-glycerol-3-phosphate acyltransferase